MAILYYNFLDPAGNKQKIGGVETYLWNLANLILERGDVPLLIQPAVKAFERQVGSVRVIGVEKNRRNFRNNTRKDLYEHAMSIIDKTQDIIIFGADHASVRTDYPRALSIQHGISWDVPGRLLRKNFFGKFFFVPDWFCKKYTAYRAYLYFNNCSNRVCVDYNYLNWYRTQITDHYKGNLWTILNFVNLPNGYQPKMERHKSSPVKVIFARRFEEIRGLLLMIPVVEKLLSDFVSVEFCFAGEGPGHDLIFEKFKNEPRVSIIKYMPDESLQVHESFHIAVVPSIGSEGSSLSLAEAMGAGCAVVATDVGGMTNMVIDGYNGRLIAPSIEGLESALIELVRDRNLCLKLGERAVDTAREAFSSGQWKSKWSQVLDVVEAF